MTTERVRFPQIASRAWEHPADRAALQSLRRVPGFDAVLKAVLGVVSERPLQLITRASALEIGPDQLPRVNALYEDVLAILDAPERYPLFVTQNPVINAGAVGMREPFIVLNSATLSLSDDQLRSVLGHEVGHILSDHVLYKTMLRLLLSMGSMLLRVPVTGLALYAVLGALLEWDRKSELSADRASLLACQDPEVVRLALLRVAGGVEEGLSVDAFREQGRRFREEGGLWTGVLRTLTLIGRSHPFPVQRVAELDRWVESGEYGRLLLGEYPRRGDAPEESAWSLWRASAGGYAEDLRQATDPLARWFKDAGQGVSERAEGVWSRLLGRRDAEEAPPEDEP